MKKKRNYLVGLAIALCFTFTFMYVQSVDAANPGSAAVSFSTGTPSVNIGQNITVKMSVHDISVTDVDGLGSIGGTLSFDPEYLEYVSSASLTSEYNFSFYSVTSKFAWVYNGITGIKKNTDLMSFTFKTKKIGNTSVTLKNLDLSDTIPNRLTGSFTGVSLNITDTPPVLSGNANLASLGVNGHNITPAFNKNNTNYSLTVGESVTSVTVNGAVEDNKSTVTGTGLKNLNVGNNTVSVIVTAEDGTKKTYTINITRESGTVVSSDNSLKSLSISGYSLSPLFSSSNTNYTLKVPYNATEIMVNATKNNDKASVSITGNNNLVVGDNEVKIVVTAEDGSKKTYSIIVTRESKDAPKPEYSDDATLSKLYIGGYTLSPIFKKNINVYSINVGEKVEGLSVDAVATDSKATVKISGNTNWKYGVNQISIVVTAEDGTKNTYIVNVTRTDPFAKGDTVKSGDNYLASLSVRGADINPKFGKNTSIYSVNLPYEIENLDVLYKTSSAKAKVKVTGNKDLKVNEVNTIEIEVTAEDGSVRIYTINATRSATTSNSNLKNITVKDFQLSPNFNSVVYEYKVKVKHNTDSLNIDVDSINKNAKIEILGNENFKAGNNVVLIKVTDENGFSQVYQIQVEKPEFSILGMSAGQFTMFSVIGLGILAILILMIILLKKKNKETPREIVKNNDPVQPMPTGPVIDFKPEFNFGSRNGTDDDIVYPNAVLNQNSEIKQKLRAPEEDNHRIIESVQEAIPYDPYDDIVTKDELYDAINEGLETKNTEKLKVLLEQERLNRRKEELKQEESETNTSRYHDFDDDRN